MEVLHVYQPLLAELGWSVSLLIVVLCLRLLWCRVDRRVVILLPVMWGSFSAMASVLDALSAVRDVAGIHLWTRRDAAVDALGLLGVGAAASALVGVVAGFGRAFVLNPPHATRAGSLIVTATGLTVAGLGSVLWLVTREAAISERAMELAGRAVQLATAGIGAVAVAAMIWRAQPWTHLLTRWSLLGIAAAAAVVALTCLFCATRLQPTLALVPARSPSLDDDAASRGVDFPIERRPLYESSRREPRGIRRTRRRAMTACGSTQKVNFFVTSVPASWRISSSPQKFRLSINTSDEWPAGVTTSNSLRPHRAPQLRRSATPQYGEHAMRAGVEGTIFLNTIGVPRSLRHRNGHCRGAILLDDALEVHRGFWSGVVSFTAPCPFRQFPDPGSKLVTRT